MHRSNYSRKQYSPLSPSSPEESDSPPERVNIDLMQELRHVIFPNSPPVDRTVRIFLIYIYYVEIYGKFYNKHKFENVSIMSILHEAFGNSVVEVSLCNFNLMYCKALLIVLRICVCNQHQ